MALAATGRNLYGPTKFVDLSFVFIQATMVAGAVVRDGANSSPETTIALGTAGQFTCTFPSGNFVQILNILVCREAEAAGVGQSVHCETMTMSPGTLAFETTSETVDTPVTPTDGSRIYVTLIVGNQ
jgi:hypothetical protein